MVYQGNCCTKASLKSSQHREDDISRLTDSTVRGIQENYRRHICDLWAGLSYEGSWLESDHKGEITCTLATG